MNRMMMTVAAMALAAPAFAQDAAAPAPADGTQMDQTAPAEGTMAQDPAAPMTTTDGTMTDTGGTATTGTGGTMPAEGTATTDTMATDGTMTTEGTAVEAQPMATEGAAMGQTAELSAENPGITASWLMDRAIYTTNQPSTTAWTDTTGDTVPGDWNEIANVADLVMTADGELVGYVADIGGFLGLGAHTVLLSQDMLHVSRFGDDVVLATNYTQEELEALPEFDTSNLMD